MKIILDEREISLRDKCSTILLPSTTLSHLVLPLGDILIKNDQDTDVILIERKSLADLIASIKDGRYEEQSYRLQHSSGFHPHNIVYIIEGMYSSLRNPAEKKIVYSAMTSLSLFKGFSVIRTNNLQETAEWVCSVADKLEREMNKGKTLYFSKRSENLGNSTISNQPNESDSIVMQSVDENLSTPTTAGYCSVVKKVKKDNITPANIGEIMLCQIPGISSVSAMAIMSQFQSFPHFLEELKKNPHCLDTIVCTTAQSGGGTKTRKLSKSVADNIRLFLLAPSA